MIVKIKSKEELQNISVLLKNVTSSFTAENSSLIGNLSDSEDFDGIVISGAAAAIQNNLRVVSSEMECLSSKLINYAADIKALDTYDFDAVRHENYSSTDINDNSKRESAPLFLFENGIDVK